MAPCCYARARRFRIAVFTAICLVAASAHAGGSPGLTDAELAKSELAVRVQGGKTGAGYDEIAIGCTGEVRLSRTLAQDKPPEVRKGHVDRALSVALCSMALAENILDRDERHENDRSASHWNTTTLTLALPTRRKTVAVESGRLAGQDQAEWLHRLVGAARLIARVAFPEESGGGHFFRWL